MQIDLRKALLCGVAVLAILQAERARAESSQQPPTVSNATAANSGASGAGNAAAACFPTCRVGYVCNQGRCVSMCNPPCPDDESCVDGVRCEVRTASALYEPPPPPPPLAPKSFADRTHSALGFHLGFGGSVEGNGKQNDLDTTIGFNIREDIPVIRYVLVGPLFQFGAWRPDVSSNAPDRSYYVDADLYVRGRIPIELDPIGVELWGGVPIGISLDFLGSDGYPGLDGFGFGWNVGILFGGAVHFTKTFGMFAELGWMQHKVSHDRSPGQGSADFRLSQGNFNVGFVFGN